MAGSVIISRRIISSQLLHKNKYLSSIFIKNRNFCSKSNDGKPENCSADDSSDVKKEKKSEGLQKKSKRLSAKTAPITEETKEAAKQKLKSLLLEITVESGNGDKSKSSLNLAKAVKRISKKERLKQMKEKIITPEKEMNMAVKAVASNFKSDSEKIESELTEKLTTLNLSEKTHEEELQNEEEMPLVDEKISANLMSSVEEVAETISEEPIPSRSELTKRLVRLSLAQKLKSNKSMKSVIEGMVIKSQRPPSSPQGTAVTRTQQMVAEKKMAIKRYPLARKIEKVNLFDEKPLNIFSPEDEVKPDSSNLFWQKLQERELRLLTQFAPANAFEEMIMWTEQGKHWKLPVDNETEMGEEEKVGFHEHVFLEQYLKGFPTKGPIRHFMELVCVGLSKNPYLPVERKIENIEWFRNYFKEKEEILKDTGVLE